MKPDYSGIPVVSALSEVIAGSLWQGARPTSYQPWDIVVSCEQHLARKPAQDWDGVLIHVPMRDEDTFIPDLAALEAAALAVRTMLDANGKALIHCTGGLNRSSLVTVEVLVTYGMSRTAAVAHVRMSRDPWCLCNRAFERFALREFLPTAQTSAFAEVERGTPAAEPPPKGVA